MVVTVNGQVPPIKVQLKDILLHPAIIITFVLFLLSTSIAVFLFFQSQKERNLVYMINPVRTNLVTAGQLSGITIGYNGKQLGNQDITAAQLAIWNDGRESIRKEHVLDQIAIQTNPPVQLLEASIIKTSRGVTKFALQDSDKEMNYAQGRIPLDWSILEKNDGAVIQIIYLGKPDVDIHVSGTIEGTENIKSITANVKIRSPLEQVQQQKLALIPLIFLIVLSVGWMIFFLVQAIRYKTHKKRRLLIIWYSVFLLVLVAWSIWAYQQFVYISPPFGF